MSRAEGKETTISDGQFDRLVDGELSETERRELLSRLDDEIDGWRRCATAFLQHQCLKESLGPLADPRSPEVIRELSFVEAAALPEYRPATSGRRRWRAALRTLAAMAASFAVALWVGWLVGSGRRGPDSVPIAASNANTNREAPIAVRAEANRPGDTSGMTAPWRLVTLQVPGADGGRVVRVPAFERESLDESWLGNVPGMPEELLRQLHQTGHRVQRTREIMPVPLDDGRRLIVPVEQVEVHPAVYQ